MLAFTLNKEAETYAIRHFQKMAILLRDFSDTQKRDWLFNIYY